jgi:hypothetical protein
LEQVALDLDFPVQVVNAKLVKQLSGRLAFAEADLPLQQMGDLQVQPVTYLRAEPVRPVTDTDLVRGISPAQVELDRQFQVDMALSSPTEIDAVEFPQGPAIAGDRRLSK